MNIIESLWSEIVGFFGVRQFLEIMATGSYDQFLTY